MNSNVLTLTSATKAEALDSCKKPKSLKQLITEELIVMTTLTIKFPDNLSHQIHA